MRAFRQVDVFGEDPGTGNPVAVVLDADGIDDETMVRFSEWSNLSEVTFVLPPTAAGADYRVRIFSVRTELPFAGHPTLGTARAWLDAGGIPLHDDLIVQQCGAGLVSVRADDDVLSFAAPPLVRSGPVDDRLRGEVIAIAGVDPDRVVDAQWLDNGPGWVGLLLDDDKAVLDATPDASGHPGVWDIGLIAPAASGAAHRFEVRAFFTDGRGPLREDPVTGSLNAAAAAWMIRSGRARAPYTVRQGTALGRRGRVHVGVDEGQLWVGGRAEVVVSGSISL